MRILKLGLVSCLAVCMATRAAHAQAASLAPIWKAEGNQANAAFGISVSTAGDVNGDGFDDVIVGASGFSNGQTSEGGAFVYLGSSTGPGTQPAWSAEGNQAYSAFGNAVASAGDVNGDGFGDVIVGAPFMGFNHGRAFVYHGSAAGLAASQSWTAAPVGFEFAWSVASAGDVNGDGFGDVIIGAIAAANDQENEGLVYVYLGSPAGLEALPSWIVEGNQANPSFGRCVASAGDVNGDGFDDVLVGAPWWHNGQGAEGRAFLYLGSASGLAASAAWTTESNQSQALLGFSLASAGDVDGDGYDDVVVGASGFSNPESGEGRAWLYRGSPAGLATSAAWTAELNLSAAFFGWVAPAGDLNGDGFGDVIVGAYGTAFGRVLAYLGSPSGLATRPTWGMQSDRRNSFYGYALAGAGDVNGDGYGDVIVGAAEYDNGQHNEGRAFCYFGTPLGRQTR